jgi:hypothetical protein
MRFYLYIILAFSFTSCISTKQYSGIVESKIKDYENNTEVRLGNLSFDLSELKTQASPVISTRIRWRFIPALVYWHWEKNIKSEIDPKIMGNSFIKDFFTYAADYHLQEKLKGRTLEIKVERIPHSFVYTTKGYSLILGIAYMVSNQELIHPIDTDLIISYRITENGSLLKEGELLASFKKQSQRNFLNSTKKFTWQFIDQLHLNTNQLTKEIVEQLSNEL